MARKSADTEQRSGRPVEVSTPLLKNNGKKMILTDIRLTVKDISLKYGHHP